MKNLQNLTNKNNIYSIQAVCCIKAACCIIIKRIALFFTIAAFFEPFKKFIIINILYGFVLVVTGIGMGSDWFLLDLECLPLCEGQARLTMFS